MGWFKHLADHNRIDSATLNSGWVVPYLADADKVARYHHAEMDTVHQIFFWVEIPFRFGKLTGQSMRKCGRESERSSSMFCPWAWITRTGKILSFRTMWMRWGNSRRQKVVLSRSMVVPICYRHFFSMIWLTNFVWWLSLLSWVQVKVYLLRVQLPLLLN